jgi:pilus assembly protein CpaB
MRINKRAILFFGLAALFAVAATYTARDLLHAPAATAAAIPIETTTVVVARADVGTGVVLRDAQLATVEWPAEFVPEGSFASIAEAANRVPRRPLAQDEPVLEAALLPIGAEAGLVSVISEDLRAVSVKVDPVIGVAGFVRPGARVDVLATLRRIDRSSKLPYSRVILQDIAVLAIDQKMETASDGDPELVSVVTLHVNPQQAEQLIYSAHEGRLQLALRGPGDHEVIKTRSIGVADIMGQPSTKKKHRTVSSTSVQVLKGSSVSNSKF